MSIVNRLVCLIFISLSLISVSHAAVYKWTDPSGKVHYSDKPPTDQKATTLNPNTAIPTGADDARKELDKREDDYNKRREDRLKAEEEAKKKAAAEEKRKQDCVAMRNNLQTYITRNRVNQVVDGEVVTIPFEERLKKMEELQKAIEKTCKGL